MPHRLPKYKFWIYFGSIVFPLFGVAYGVLAMSKPERSHRRMGKWCTALGIVSLITICLGSIVLMVVNIGGDFGFLT